MIRNGRATPGEILSCEICSQEKMKMKTVGIIAEYNPFHTGHEYHIRKAKELTGADYVVVVMSPDFVQRGEPAVFDKYARTDIALRCGADLVIELPVCYATGSAEYFAEGAAALLNALGVVDVLCFGAETDDPVLFERTARILSDEPEEFKTALKESLKNGFTFPQARSRALSLFSWSGNEEYPETPDQNYDDNYEFPSICVSQKATSSLAEFAQTPNNILGIEYCRALYKFKSNIRPLPLKRIGSEYNSSRLDRTFCSATALRAAISDNSEILYETDRKFGHGVLHKEYNLNENAWKRMQKFVPEACRDIFYNRCQTPIYMEDFLSYLNLRLLDSALCTESASNALACILDISPDLADRIAKLRFSCIGKSYSEIVALLKTKQITEARIRRALLHLLLGIRIQDVEQYRADGTVFYAHVLGFRKGASELLHEIKERSTVPLITKTASASKMLEEPALSMWEQDLYATHLYRSVQAAVYGIPFRTEYECSPVIYRP